MTVELLNEKTPYHQQGQHLNEQLHTHKSLIIQNFKTKQLNGSYKLTRTRNITNFYNNYIENKRIMHAHRYGVGRRPRYRFFQMRNGLTHLFIYIYTHVCNDVRRTRTVVIQNTAITRSLFEYAFADFVAFGSKGMHAPRDCL